MNLDVTPISRIHPPITTTIQKLPFEELQWEVFEDLCLKLVQIEFGVNNCEKRGIKGQNQQGIDIFARHKDGRFSVYQCKRYRNFNKSDLKNVISEFQKGEYYSKSKRFFICTSCELTDVKIQDNFEECKILLKKDNIELVKWDKVQLSRIFKEHPKIVNDIFGLDFVKAFNGEAALARIFQVPDELIHANFRFASSDLYNINNSFSNVPESHLERKETSDLKKWIYNDLDGQESNICILAGNAGTGKSVILKDLIHLLNENNTPVLGLKSDKKDIDVHNLGKSVLDIDATILDVFRQLLSKHSLVVILVDQIDALSRSLSTKRSQLKAYGTLINQLSMLKDVKIIVSCRIFDLNYEPEFKQFTNKKVFKLSLLSENEVGTTLKKLTDKDLNDFPKTLINLLKTPLHLDVFCKIYSNSALLNEIKS